jgi:hypothetical protein
LTAVLVEVVHFCRGAKSAHTCRVVVVVVVVDGSVQLQASWSVHHFDAAVVVVVVVVIAVVKGRFRPHHVS